MFASNTTSTIEIGDVVVTIKKLSWKSLRSAAQAQFEAQIGLVSKINKTDLAAAFKQTEAPSEPKEDALPAPPQTRSYGLYDRAAVLAAGVKSWTAKEKLPAALDDLEEEAAETIFKAIIDLSVPDPAQQDDARKNA